jgi:hypothetical protein
MSKNMVIRLGNNSLNITLKIVNSMKVSVDFG